MLDVESVLASGCEPSDAELLDVEDVSVLLPSAAPAPWALSCSAFISALTKSASASPASGAEPVPDDVLVVLDVVLVEESDVDVLASEPTTPIWASACRIAAAREPVEDGSVVESDVEVVEIELTRSEVALVLDVSEVLAVPAYWLLCSSRSWARVKPEIPLIVMSFPFDEERQRVTHS